MNSKTSTQYQQVVDKCKEIFLKKTADYGTSWRILRLPSITDQIFIKAQRIRSFQEKGVQKVNEDIVSEFIAIVNYSIIALIQLKLSQNESLKMSAFEVEKMYDNVTKEVKNLLDNKNHDYDEAWRNMRVSSMTDLILMKIMRTKQIEDNDGKTTISEGVDANYMDMLNYSVFCLIKLNFVK